MSQKRLSQAIVPGSPLRGFADSAFQIDQTLKCGSVVGDVEPGKLFLKMFGFG
jgi:hypothetical protein